MESNPDARSSDKGRDVIVFRDDIGAIRVLDQVKRYKPVQESSTSSNPSLPRGLSFVMGSNCRFESRRPRQPKCPVSRDLLQSFQAPDTSVNAALRT
jgi:hypothetical protein